ncbi:blue copper protein-like [Heracleum sosnowskyi]|uniref:Blue copper protein-like n=1 Tax=Heracleum sosnowskyi TaxID=360622 RepID=A0AAD8HBS2_9APIA|nr:blue copper protein-like [Heracleum sosnowskyi]
MAFPSVLLVLSLLAVPAVYGVDHTVGGSSGWDQGVNFASWAAGKKFVVGDNLVFSYGSSHSVDEVSQSDYSTCSASKPINSYSGGKNTVALNKTGSVYFLCPSSGHCTAGMKLSVTVAAASTPTPSTPTPTTPSTPTPTTPSTPTPTTPSTPPKEDTPPSSPDTPSTSPSAAVGGFGDMNKLVVGVCIVFAGLMGFMG